MVVIFGLGGSAYQTTLNGKPVWRASKSVRENGRRKQIKGTGQTADIAVKRLEHNYKKWLVASGQASSSILPAAPMKNVLLYGDFLDGWLADLEHSGAVQAPTLVRYRGTVEAHIKPHIGAVPIRALDEKTIRVLLMETLPSKRRTVRQAGGQLLDRPLLGNSPMRKIYDLLNGSLRDAVKSGHIEKNPMGGIRRIAKSEPRDEDIQHKTWIPERLMEYLYGGDDARWILAFYGLRQSERLGLEHTSFANLDSRRKPTELLLNRQLLRDPTTGKLSIKYNTKTAAGKRKLVLPDEVSEILRAYKKRQAEWRRLPSWSPEPGLENLFFTTPEGKPIRHQTDNKQWRALLKEHGIDHIRGHAMRHVTATLLAKSPTTHPDVARRILGHASAAMTTYYTHLDGSDTEQALAAISDRILVDWLAKREKAGGAKRSVGGRT